MAKKKDLKEMIDELDTTIKSVDDVVEDAVEETMEDVVDEELSKEVEITIINFEKYGFVKKDVNSLSSNFAQMQKYRATIEEEHGNAIWFYLIDCGVYVLLEKKDYAICK